MPSLPTEPQPPTTTGLRQFPTYLGVQAFAEREAQGPFCALISPIAGIHLSMGSKVLCRPSPTLKGAWEQWALSYLTHPCTRQTITDQELLS